jgi:hypothetical protein
VRVVAVDTMPHPAPFANPRHAFPDDARASRSCGSNDADRRPVSRPHRRGVKFEPFPRIRRSKPADRPILALARSMPGGMPESGRSVGRQPDLRKPFEKEFDPGGVAEGLARRRRYRAGNSGTPFGVLLERRAFLGSLRNRQSHGVSLSRPMNSVEEPINRVARTSSSTHGTLSEFRVS